MLMFKYCKKCVSMRQFLPIDNEVDLYCDVCKEIS